MKAELSSVSPFFTALILKLAGIILILGTLVDFIFLTLPPNFLNNEWLSSWITECVGRGTIPMIGIALILFGVWVERSIGTDSASQKIGRGWLLGSLILAGILGLLFLLSAPIYFNSSRLASAAASRRINEEATQAEQALNSQLEALNSQLEVQRAQVSALLSSPEQLAQLQEQLQNAELPAEQQQFLQEVQKTLQEVQANPGALDQKIEEARQEGLTQIQQEQAQVQQEREQAQAALTAQMRQSRLRVTTGSLLLAVGYLAIAGSGTGKPKSGKSKAKTKKTRSRNG
ncbi:MAG: hypothetical protein HC769_00230 [Cyanobacteria bacterium CRU_2_1]|nr:hypothetical protein [Cyanobacteria bacterium RU_5_0]NJR57407.1 hypothetical protein [Cyanobacteria bacterium CRU_2_1]